MGWFLSRVFALATVAVASLALWGALTQPSSLVLREQRPAAYWAHYNTQLSGSYDRRSGTWRPSSVRTAYGSFRGGGPGAGK